MRLSDRDQEWLWAEIAHGIRRKQPLPELIEALGNAAAGTRRGKACRLLAHRLRQGQSFGASVAAEQKLFSPGSAVTIEAGEKSGRLAESLYALSSRTRFESTLRFNVIHALLYPMVLCVGTFGIFLFTWLRVIPFMRDLTGDNWGWGMYHSNWFEELMTGGGIVIVEPIFVSFIVLPMLALIFLYVMPTSRFTLLDRIRLRIPLLGKAMRHFLIARWCREIGVLTSAGVTAPQAVRIAGESSGNAFVNSLSREIAELVEQGVTLDGAMRLHRFFPPTLVWMISAMRRRGRFQDVWEPAQELHARLADRSARVASIVLRLIFLCGAIAVAWSLVMIIIQPILTMIRIMGNCSM